MLIFKALFDFPAEKVFMFWNYHNNILCKILDDLKKFLTDTNQFSKNHPNAKCIGPKKCNPKTLNWLFFTYDQLSHKRTVHNLKGFKESFMVAFLDFMYLYLLLFVSFLDFSVQKTKKINKKCHYKTFILTVYNVFVW